MSLLDKLTDFIMPQDESQDFEEEREEKVQEKTAEKATAKVTKEAEVSESFGSMRMAAGGGGGYAMPSYAASSATEFPRPSYARPHHSAIGGSERVQERGFSVYKNDSATKENIMQVEVRTPDSFDQAQYIARDIRQGRVVFVNYDKVSSEIKFKIRTFMMGACFALDGGLKYISDTIDVYVPAGVDLEGELVKTAMSSTSLF